MSTEVLPEEVPPPTAVRLLGGFPVTPTTFFEERPFLE
jgi:hypothetical protein